MSVQCNITCCLVSAPVVILVADLYMLLAQGLRQRLAQGPSCISIAQWTLNWQWLLTDAQAKYHVRVLTKICILPWRWRTRLLLNVVIWKGVPVPKPFGSENEPLLIQGNTVWHVSEHPLEIRANFTLPSSLESWPSCYCQVWVLSRTKSRWKGQGWEDRGWPRPGITPGVQGTNWVQWQRSSVDPLHRFQSDRWSWEERLSWFQTGVTGWGTWVFIQDRIGGSIYSDK